MRSGRRWLGICTASLLAACTPDVVDAGESEGAVSVGAEESTGSSGDGDGDGSGDGDGDASGDGDGEASGDGDGDAPSCECAPGTDLIYLASKFGEIYTYDPLADSYAEVGQVTCGSGLAYSMAVDQDNHGWVVDLDSRDLIRIDLDNPSSCTEPPYVPGNQGFQYPGTAFVGHDTLDACEKLYLLNYSAEGPFAEGPGIGQLGVYDPLDGSVEVLANIDYDGGELDGTSDGRLFAFAGNNPAKLIEYQRETGEVVEITPLEGLEKTGASAFAFHSGDFYFFTEAPPPGCFECLEQCTPTYATCMADPECAESFQCAFDAGEITDDCGGLMPGELMNCLGVTCLDACFPIGGKPSQVTRLDFDGSEGQGMALEVVNAQAPIRVVGAGTSICAPLQVP